MIFLRRLLIAIPLLVGASQAAIGGDTPTPPADPTQVETSQGPTPSLFPLERYKPIYFLLGRPQTKVAISFKIPILRDGPLYFVYSHVLFWDLFHKSSPFLDLNSSTAVFYRLLRDGNPDHAVDIGIWEHESNGKDGADSRAWDRTYVRYQYGGSGKSPFIGWSAKAWVAYRLDNPNRDLRRYRGLYEIEVVASGFFGGFFEVNDLSLRLTPGGAWGIDPLRGSQELTLRLKSEQRSFRFPMAFQVFHGYAENLLQYRDKHWGIRAGLGF